MTALSVVGSVLSGVAQQALGEGGGYSFVNGEAAALVARFTTPPNSQRKAQIDAFVGSLKAAGVWAKLDVLYVMAAADSQAARLNWLADQYTAAPFSSPVFAEDRGYSTDGTTSYLDTGFNPSTAVSPKFAVADGSIGFWSRTSGQAGFVDMGQTFTLLTSRNSSDQISHRVNWSVSGGTTSLDGSGHWVTSRTGAAREENKAYKNAALVLGAVGTGTAEALENSTIQIGKRGGNALFSARQFAAAHIGGGLSEQNITDLYAALNTYLTAVGAA